MAANQMSMRNQREIQSVCEAAKRSGGFTLIELMVVVAVVAILGAIAFPSYQDAVRKGHRGQAKADLVDLAQRAERYRTVNGSYAGFSLSAADQKSPRQGTTRYNVSLTLDNAAPRTFLLKATPTTAQKDPRCRVLVLNHLGQKTIEGNPSPTGTAADCW